MIVRPIRIVTYALLLIAVSISGAGAKKASKQQLASQESGTIHLQAFDLPPSSLMTSDARAGLENWAKVVDETIKACVGNEDPDEGERLLVFRQCAEERFWLPLVARSRSRYDVHIRAEEVSGIYTEVVTPAEGIPVRNRSRVLINLHGGGFSNGARYGGQVESIPIAALGKIKVVSVDYRMAPEHRFPAASEDVAAVYRSLLNKYEAQNIGIYGCSAGAVLTAQTVAWLQKEGLPTPGAVGLFCGAGTYWTEGDSGHIDAAMTGYPRDSPSQNPYFRNANLQDPLVFPLRSEQVLAKFPPSLLISATRDRALSSVVHMHSRLVALGVEADLHVWEGLGHAFFNEPDLPQSREVHDVAVKFFDRHLGPQSPFRVEIERFIETDRAHPQVPCQVLFVGSSSIVLWKSLATDMAPMPVINRGFGGAQIDDVNRWFDEVVTPYQPRAIVFYAGENDLDAGKSPERVLVDFEAFMARKTAVLGVTPVYFVSLKPSKRRAAQLAAQTKFNDAIRALAERRSDLRYVDVVGSMLEAGSPKDLFIEDGLHMNAKGYALWTGEVKAALVLHGDTDAQRCYRSVNP